MTKQKLKGEFICFEVRDEQKRLLRVNVFYNGILHHTWENPRP
jgi:hypothetical protein